MVSNRLPPAGRIDGFPRSVLMAAGGLVLFTILAASYGSLTGLGRPAPTGIATAARSLRFADRADGAVIVTLAGTGQVVDVMTGQNGFLRGTLRGFARTRRADGVGAQPPFQLTGYADGRLTLTDPSTGRVVELEAFGSQNEAVFVRLLTKAPLAPASQTASLGMGKS